MNKHFYPTDERMVNLTGRISIVFLVLTQTALMGSILYRRNLLEQPSSEYADIRLILLVSVFGFIATRLYFGAVLPKLSFGQLTMIYIGLVVVLFVILSLWLGLPSIDNWKNTLLPVLLGPAILVILYGVLAYWGQKRIDRKLDDE